MSFESILEHYPKTIKTKRGPTLTIRPLATQDAKPFGDFFRALPHEELMFLKERLTDQKVVKRLCDNLDFYPDLPLLGFADKQLVAVALLHQHQGGWKRHIGAINVHTHPKFRGKGIGRVMINEIIDVARQMGLERLEAEFFDSQVGAIKLFGLLGFSNLVQLPDYVKDMQAVSHDYILMGLKLTTEEEYAGVG